MPDDLDRLLRLLVGGDDGIAQEIRDRAETDPSPAVLVAAALVTADPTALIARAATMATSTRDRQLVTIATAHLANDAELVDALVRDHLTDHPDNVLVAWIAAQHTRTGGAAGDRAEE